MLEKASYSRIFKEDIEFLRTYYGNNQLSIKNEI
jgi:hypothetical protein